MAFSQVVKTYPQLASMNEDVPTSIGSDVRPRPIPSSVRTVSIASSNGAQKANGFNSFWLPSGSSAGIIKPYSMYLRTKIKVSGTAAKTFKFASQAETANSSIERMTATMNNQQIEQLNHYNVWADILLSNTTSKSFYETDAAILMGANVQYTFDGNGNCEINVVLPILLSTFNNPKGVPLYLLNQPIQIQVDWASLANTFFGTDSPAAAITDVEYSNSYLVYQSINVDEQYKNAVRMSMADPSNPKLYQLNITNVLGSNVSHASSTISQNLGVNYSSLRGVVYTNIIDPANTTTGGRAAKKNGQTNAKLLLDGTTVNNFQLDNTAVIKAELDATFGNLWDSNMTFISTPANYETEIFAAGIGTTKFQDGSCSFVGMPCQNLQLEINSDTTNGNKLYYFLLSDQAITIDAMGNVVMIR